MKRRCYLLVEILVVMMVLLVLSNILYPLFYDGVRTLTVMTRTAWREQRVLLVQREWLSFIHSLPADTPAATAAGLAGQTWSATIDGDQLLLRNAQQTRPVVLPADATATVAWQPSANGGCGVLTVSWPEPRGPGNRQRHARLVACRCQLTEDTDATP